MKKESNTHFNGYFFADPHGRIIHANESLRHMCGYDYAALEGSPVNRLFCDGQGGGIDGYEMLQSDAEVRDWHTHIRHCQGEAIAVTAHLRQVKDDQGYFSGFEGSIVLDVAISTVLRRGKSLHSMLDNNPSPMIRVTKDAVVVYANKASAVLLKTLGGAMGKVVSRGWKNWISQVFQMNQVMEIDVACLGTDYDCRFVPQGKELLIYAIDVTDRKLNEENLEEACDTLQQQVKAQQLTLKAEQQVRHMSEQALLDARSVKKNSLTTVRDDEDVIGQGILHDVNNMLGVVMGNASLVLGDVYDVSATLRRTKRIINAAKSAASMCEELMSLKRETSLQHSPISVSEMLKKAELLLENGKGHEKVQLVFRHHSEALLVQASHQKLQRMVMNMVLNGVESMGDSYGEVIISADIMEMNQEDIAQCQGFAHAEAGCYAYIAVADNGCGMDEATLQQLFQPYFTTKSHGHGLGMTTMLRLVQSCAGLIQVQSGQGEGTVVRVLFPLICPMLDVEDEVDILLHSCVCV